MTTVTPNDLHEIQQDLRGVVIERDPDIHDLIRGALAGVNICQLGPPGAGKSLLLRAFCNRITGSRYFSKNMHAQMPADSIIGGVDIPKLVNDGEFVRNVTNYMPNAHVIFLDELYRSNGPTLDAILPTLNVGERLAEGNGGMFKTPALFMVFATNFVPEQDDPQYGAAVDRITMMQYIDYVKADASFEQMVMADHVRRVGERDGNLQMKTITLEQFTSAQDQVARVEPTAEFAADFAKLRRTARSDGCGISDRAFLELALVARAEAWLNGRDKLASSDLVAIENGLWRDKDDRAQARQWVKPYLSDLLRHAIEARTNTEPHLAKLVELRPLVEGVPTGGNVPSETMTLIQAESRSLGESNKRINRLVAQAEKDGVNVPDLRDLQNDLQAAREWLDANYLPARWPD